MPKIIEEAQNKILEAAREQFLSCGYSGTSIRAVAKACGIASGTIYNYYRSKDMLAGSVMLEDWLAAMEHMRQGAAAADSLRAGFSCVHEALTAFETRYKRVWEEYSFTGRSQKLYQERHVQLVSQLCEVLHPLLERFGAAEDAYLDIFLAENLLTVAADGYPFERFSELIGRILQPTA